MFYKKENKIFLSPPKKWVKRKKNHRAPLVKCTKSYYIYGPWVANWCLSREGRMRIGFKVLIFSVPQHQMQPSGRCRDRKTDRALKGRFWCLALCLSVPWGPSSVGSKEVSGSSRPSVNRTPREAPGKRAESKYFPDSPAEWSPEGLGKGCGPAGVCGLHWISSPWIRRWDL